MNSKINRLEYGTNEDFITNQKYWAVIQEKYNSNIASAIKQEQVVKITTENNAVLIINMSPEKIKNEKSNYKRFINKYGQYPEIEMNIETEDGDYPKILL